MNKMMNRTDIRTDLALEARESFPEDDVEIKGVVLEEEYQEEKDIKVTTVIIKDDKASEAMKKPIGTYITIEADYLSKEDEKSEQLADEIGKYIEDLSGGIKDKSVLICGLGNREVTPDSLGPDVVDSLFVTRHLIKEFGDEFKEKNKLESMSAISPGVMAQTGMESVEIISGIAAQTKPDLIIVIDALAARSIHRVNSTVQITDTGISPGSGVGNNRKALNKETLGIPVIALGVPTVVDAATIVSDRLESVLSKQGFSEDEVNGFIASVYDQEMTNMFVTPKNVDDAVKHMSETISEALNRCFSSY